MKQELRETLFHIELLKRKKVQDFLLEAGLTPGQGQARILNFLLSNMKSSQREIAEQCHLDETTMSRNLDKMEKQGLLSKKRDPKCRRTCMVSLTPEGTELAKEVKKKFEELETIMFCGFSQKELEQMKEQLCRIRTNLERAGEQKAENTETTRKNA